QSLESAGAHAVQPGAAPGPSGAVRCARAAGRRGCASLCAMAGYARVAGSRRLGVFARTAHELSARLNVTLMDLTTRCPQCGTTFSASLEQLQLRKGYIRCINCAHIFDGYEAVVSPGGAPAVAGDRPSAAVEPKVSMPSVLRQRPSEAAERTHTVSRVADERDDGFTISADPQPARAGQDPVFHFGGNGLRVRGDPPVDRAEDGASSGPRVAGNHPEIY